MGQVGAGNHQHRAISEGFDQRIGQQLGVLQGEPAYHHRYDSRARAHGLDFTPRAAVDWRLRHVPLPLKPPDAERVAWAREHLEAHPDPTRREDGSVDPQWIRAVSITSVELMRHRGPNCSYEIQALRIGDAAVVGLPGEPFVEGQLAIKIASPTWPTYLAHAVTQYVGYIPTDAAQRRGGHEVDFSYWAKLAPGALDRVVANATELLCELFEDKSER